MTESSEDKGRRSHRGFGSGLVAGAVLGIALSGAVALGAGALAAGHLGWGHGRGGFFRHDDPEAAREHVALATDWILTRVDATADQKEQAKRIVSDTFDDLMPLVQEHRSNHESFAEEMTKASVDPEAIERLRRNQVELFDRASREVSSSLTELASILTPEQRAELVSMAKTFRH